MALVPTKQTFASSSAVSEGLTSEKDACFHPQEMSSRPQPAISVKETQPTPKRERNSLSAPENPQRLRSSPSSLEINPPSFIPSQPTLFYLLEEIVAIKGTLRMLSESSTQIQVELSKMSGNITKIHTWMEKSEPSTEQVGDHQRRLRPVKQEPLPPPAHKPVCSVDKCSCSFCPKPKLEKKLIYQTANTASLVGDPMGQLRVVSQKELTPLKGKRKYATLQTLEPIREDMRLEMAQNKMENQQVEIISSCSRTGLRLLILTIRIRIGMLGWKDPWAGPVGLFLIFSSHERIGAPVQRRSFFLYSLSERHWGWAATFPDRPAWLPGSIWLALL